MDLVRDHLQSLGEDLACVVESTLPQPQRPQRRERRPLALRASVTPSDLRRAQEMALCLGEVAAFGGEGSHGMMCDECRHAGHRLLEDFGGFVSDSGEGRWTVLAAVEEGVPVPVLSSALYERFSSRGQNAFAAKVNAALRNQFGGHAVKAADPVAQRESHAE